MDTAPAFSDAYFTPGEVATKLRLERATVWKRIREGKIKATRGHRRLIPESELRRLLEVDATVAVAGN